MRPDQDEGNSDSPSKFIASALRNKFKAAHGNPSPVSKGSAAADDNDDEWEENVAPTPVLRSVERVNQ